MASKTIYLIVRFIALGLLVFVSACNPQKETDSPKTEENKQEQIQKDDRGSDEENDKDEDRKENAEDEDDKNKEKD
ncbi:MULTISPECIES: hypothetical protein [Aerosakkonema]|uniref:hypothetical protein n=1 Tax=Aerosakkonema TaxID=1246629 RepID=UPI0035B7E761